MIIRVGLIFMIHLINKQNPGNESKAIADAIVIIDDASLYFIFYFMVFKMRAIQILMQF